jgi:hypothetical protein
MVVRRIVVVGVVAALASSASVLGSASASNPGSDTRLSNDAPGTSGYVSNYTSVTGQPYTDATLAECSRARGRQNEPSVAVNPRNAQVIVGSSNDYCGTYNDGEDADGAPLPVGPIWLGYYRSQNGGASFQSSLVPGYPEDTSPYADRAQVRTATAGDPVLAWDGDGRLFAGSESSGDPAGTKKTFGDVWVATYENPAGVGGATLNDGKEFRRSVVVAHGSSAPNLNGVFHDKTSIAADRTNNPATRGNVYFAWSRFTNGGSNIYVVRSTNHGATFSKPKLLTTRENDIQDPDIAIRGDGTVTVTWDSSSKKSARDSINYSVSTNGGATWSPSRTLTTYISYDAQDVSAPTAEAPTSGPDFEGAEGDEEAAGNARDCGVLESACASGYIFFRRTTSPRSSADQTAPGNPWVYVVVDPVVPGSQVPTGTTYGATEVGVGGQSAVYAIRFNPLTGAKSGLVRIAPEATGHQLFADVVADSGAVHVMWWDSRNDPCYSPTRPVGNCANGTLVPSLDVFGTTLNRTTLAPAAITRVTDVTSNPNWDQFAGRTVPFAGDYLWIDSAAGRTFSTWTDYRNTVPGNDPRTADTRGDVLQCRTPRQDGTFTGDTCPRAGGLDQNIYGDLSP